jgi:hypothetical protein
MIVFTAYPSHLTDHLDSQLERLNLLSDLSAHQKLNDAPPTPVRPGVRNPPSK